MNHGISTYSNTQRVCHLYVQHVHLSRTVTSNCCLPHPTVKLLSVFDSNIWFYANLTCFLIIPPPPPTLPASLPFCSLSVVWFSPHFILILLSSFVSIPPSLTQSLSLSLFLSPSPAHRRPHWCRSLLTRLPPSPQVRPLPLLLLAVLHFMLYF